MIDPMVERCAAVLTKKRAKAWLEPAYRDTVIYTTVAAYAAAVANAPEKKPRYAPPLPIGISIEATLFRLEG